MNPAPPLPLARARNLAERVVEVLAPACDRIEIAGSIRRGMPMVADMDLVILPKPQPGALAELQRLFHSCAASAGILVDGTVSKRCLLRKSLFQCDLWIAHHHTRDLFSGLPCNWGAMLLTYTGSKEHNVKIVSRAKSLGKTFRPGHGIVEEDGTVHSVTEAEIFQSLGWNYIEPRDRQ